MSYDTTNPVRLKEDGSFAIANFSSGEVGIFKKIKDSNILLDHIHTTPNMSFIEELDAGLGYDATKIVYSYYDSTVNKYVLEQFKSSNVGTIESRVESVSPIVCIYPGVYAIKGYGDKPSLITAWGSSFSWAGMHDITGFKGQELYFFDEYQDFREKHPDILGIDLTLGLKEKLRLFLKLPTKPYEEFLVSKHFYSFMNDKSYELEDCAEEFVSPYRFSQRFNHCELAKDIASVNAIAFAERTASEKRLLKTMDEHFSKHDN